MQIIVYQVKLEMPRDGARNKTLCLKCALGVTLGTPYGAHIQTRAFSPEELPYECCENCGSPL